ncbi:hypothetical protein BABINDRAFT_59096 [Babjeviella inositovora NRRL Y-12698]|uniref:Complex 1 LYR protein domain-containing protein n=1 Tax=Babjeviella inositovora NRRL Y-12698 TaxID=984486 RepID=A0A1E3QWL1_9ASCO|nr:uncharacterized protein BABINDRAFT_59096 [Babjeviella inositovora NRRL Y-12698]ODQ82079.1 hypothetical protein BABINDRAFT_59096 [Babjeviella inositovora NRRL Y-12698]
MNIFAKQLQHTVSRFTRSFTLSNAGNTDAKVKRTFKASNIPSLDEFIFQKKVRKLYRRIVRTALKSPDRTTGRELIHFARDEFRHTKHVTDMDQRKYMLSMGMNQFRDVAKIMGLAVNDFTEFNVDMVDK